MRAVCLMDDNAGSAGFAFEHGFSLYVRTLKHELVIDSGSSGRTWENAVRLGIDPTRLDMAVLSHGHYDHSGGLIELLGMNEGIRVYMRREACGDHYSEKNGLHYIGIDKRLADDPRVTFTDEIVRIDEEISLFSNVTARRAWPEGNLLLKKKDPNLGYVPDGFLHEQYTVIENDGMLVLVSGCSHNGILNILDRFRELYGRDPQVVIGGFHMVKDGPYLPGETELIRETAAELQRSGAVFFTGHCTGGPAYQIMKEIMGNNIRKMGSGDTLILTDSFEGSSSSWQNRKWR